MARFIFKLEPLLKARRRAEQDAQRAVADLHRQRLALEDALRRHQQDISRGKDRLRESLSGRLDMRGLRLGAGSTLHVIRKAHQIVLQLAGLSERIGVARSRLLEATTRRRAIELLKERRYAGWRRALDKAETAALDELAVHAAARSEDAP